MHEGARVKQIRRTILINRTQKIYNKYHNNRDNRSQTHNLNQVSQ